MHRPIGLKKATKVGLRRSANGRLTLTRLAEERLFQVVTILNEGELREGVYFGSTMLSFDLSALADQWRGPIESEAAQLELLEAIQASVPVRIRLMRLARADAARRIPEESLGRAVIETRFALLDGQVHVDVDLEVPLRVASNAAEN